MWLVIFFLISVVIFVDFGYRVYNLKPPVLNTQVFAPYSADPEQAAPGPDETSVVMKGSAYTDCRQGLLNIFPKKTSMAGYIPFDNPTALAGLRAHCADLDTVYFDAFTLSPNADGVVARGANGAAFPLAEFNTGFVSRNRPTSFPILSPANGTTTESLEQYFGTRIQAENFRAQLDRIDLTGVDGGFCLDLENHETISAEILIPIVDDLNNWLTPKGLRSCLISRMDAGFWQNPELVSLVGQAILLGFRPTNGPTIPPVAQDWFDSAATLAQSQIAAENSSFALGSFSRAWKSGQRSFEEIPFSEAMLRANYYDGAMRFAAETGYTGARFIDENRRLNQIWIQDAASFHNQRLSLDNAAELTVWPLGYEDAAIWELAINSPEAVLEAEIDLSNYVTIEGSGPFSAHIAQATPGSRQAGMSTPDGRVESLDYTQIPSPRRIQLFGTSADLDLAITFSGLGSAHQTDILLQTLARYDISASFFLSSSDLLISEALVHKLIAAGHNIGMKTVPRESQALAMRFMATIQNNLPQLLLQDNFGHDALLVQNPSRYGQFPGDRAVLDQLQDLQTSGFIPVYSNISAPLGNFDPSVFTQNVTTVAFDASVNILSFNFTEENDSATNRVLPEILEKLKNNGFSYTSLVEISGLTPEQIFPTTNTPPVPRDQVMFWLMSVTWFGVQNFVFLLALIVALRSPIYLILAFIRREKFPYVEAFRPPITVIIPAFNEAKVIGKTLSSVLASDYPDLKVIVVDDGSSDLTADVVAEVAKNDDRLSLIRQSNHGKWFAENIALKHVETPYFAIVDADTLLQKDALKYMVQPFKSNAVGAVAGTVEIGNRDNIITACQVIEYKISQSVMRRAYEVFNGILVVPGAIGAWRTDAVIASGLVSGDTITEDADLTVALHRSKYKVIYAPNARSYTEAPNSVRAFMQQRLRWSLGMLQVAWKHRNSIIEGRPVGFISIIDAVWYRIVSSFVYPLVDLIVFSSILTWGYKIATQGALGVSDLSANVILLFFLLTFLDVLNLAAAFWFERKFEWRLLVLVPFLRFGYRQLLYISSMRSIIHALSGRLRGWGKLMRTDTATIFDEPN